MFSKTYWGTSLDSKKSMQNFLDNIIEQFLCISIFHEKPEKVGCSSFASFSEKPEKVEKVVD